MEITLDAAELTKWARFYREEVPRRTNAALARALNYIGTTIVEQTTQFIADQSGLDPNDIRPLIAVSEATAADLVWEMDASQVAPPSLDWSRPWDTKDTQTNSPFDTNTLVNIITMEDELVCQKCEDAAENSPYTLTEAQAILPVHPNCRCLLQNFVSYRRLPVVFSGSGSAPPQLFTAKGLAKAVADELKVALKAEK